MKYLFYCNVTWGDVFDKKLYHLGKSVLQLTDTGTSQYWYVQEHFFAILLEYPTILILTLILTLTPNRNLNPHPNPKP